MLKYVYPIYLKLEMKDGYNTLIFQQQPNNTGMQVQLNQGYTTTPTLQHMGKVTPAPVQPMQIQLGDNNKYYCIGANGVRFIIHKWGRFFAGNTQKYSCPPPPITVKPPIFGVLEKQGDNGGTVFGVPLFEGPVFWVLEKRGKEWWHGIRGAGIRGFLTFSFYLTEMICLFYWITKISQNPYADNHTAIAAYQLIGNLCTFYV